MKIKKIAVYFFLITNLLVIISLWWQSSATEFHQGIAGSLLALGRLSGIFAVSAILLRVLMIGRTGWIEKLFGLDKLSRVHHFNGYFAITFIILHPILLTTSYSLTTKQQLLNQFLSFLTSFDDVFNAFIAVLLFV